MFKSSEQINELATALAAAQAEITGARKNSNNPFFKSKYADLAEVWDACREPLSKHGLSLAQFPSTTENGSISLENILMHKSGQWICGDPLVAKPQKPDIQGAGGVITYMRRYCAAAIVGVAQIDDDGNGDVRQQPARSEPPPPPRDVQLKRLKNLIDRTKVQTDTFLEFYKVGDIDEMSDAALNHAIKTLEARK